MREEMWPMGALAAQKDYNPRPGDPWRNTLGKAPDTFDRERTYWRQQERPLLDPMALSLYSDRSQYSNPASQLEQLPRQMVVPQSAGDAAMMLTPAGGVATSTMGMLLGSTDPAHGGAGATISKGKKAIAELGEILKPANKEKTKSEQGGIARPNIIERYVIDPQRIYKSGIYKRPDELAREAEAVVAPEHPALKQLFGVTRGDLYDISQQGTRQGNVAPNIAFPAKAGGSYAAENVMTPGNAQRLIDTIAEAKTNAPNLTRGMVPWYVMDPAYQRLEQLLGPQRAVAEYRRFNEMMTPFSASSDVMKEINRGTGARMMADRGEFERFRQYNGLAEEARGPDFPPEMAGIISHPYHGIHTDPVTRYLQTGSHGYGKDTVKIPLYTQASGVPQTGFQTQWAVPDAHFTRAAGMSDVRRNASPGDYMGGPEYRTFAPWFRGQVATPSGLEAVPTQALMWGAYAPQTGVKTAIGAPKLELISQRMWERARELGVNPQDFRDRVLLGKEHSFLSPAMGDLARQNVA